MMTCRLLCALLVLALCCCPSVCAMENREDQDEVSPGLPPAQPTGATGAGQANNFTAPSSAGMNVTLSGTQSPEGEGKASDTRSNTGRSTGGLADTSGNSDPTRPASGTEQGQGGPGRSGSSGTAADTVQKNSEKVRTDSTSGNNSSTDQTNTNAGDTAEKSKATTITTTTTTTTTTTQAPTTTTTEAPTTTTTTRAPSLLRESDGSLSSSAWVCAPLLLAVSALAYTTLG
ncbi:putative mucin TcMUCII [Trypanosoma cruzi]|uniref:Mucin TcMUCII, putative n=2 Tax=Trypanosoma cruzi TaxID=5693 RepID=Q4DQ65_TRYCC|nr:mucin TcMUCII, putative [Trypanosoma cruzi]EAN94660.1 mucin TcMUCII, putative [Trypanosoma cruzi]PWU99603.1 putative mucin TcMUCII [Trypanosoma cruzi]RNC45269.1 mucin TcMUCII [Trypanosoma cruzi]|eukprot:XP_816511.1 mucin TcMUCII [Trypanosoma cruzi strain CL Brener]